MSDKDTKDTARPVFPVTFFNGESDPNSPITDFRAQVIPADAPEPEAPKGKSAPEPATSSSSPKSSEPTAQETPAPAPAAKGDGQNSPTESGSPTSSAQTPNGKSGPSVGRGRSHP